MAIGTSQYLKYQSILWFHEDRAVRKVWRSHEMTGVLQLSATLCDV